MTIENEQDAKTYLDDITKHLTEMTDISIEAGLHSHAAIWCAINTAFQHSVEEIQTIVDMIGMYLQASQKKYEEVYHV